MLIETISAIIGIGTGLQQLFGESEEEKKARIRRERWEKFWFSVILLVIIGAPIGGGIWLYKYFTFDYTKSIVSAVEDDNYKKAHSLLVDMSKDTTETYFNDTIVSKYETAKHFVFEKETRYYDSLGQKDKLVETLGAYTDNVESYRGTTSDSTLIAQNHYYMDEVKYYNEICNRLLTKYISKGAIDDARMICKEIKPNLTEKVEGKDYIYSFDNKAKLSAEKEIEQLENELQ